jgi:hypothetical protein
LTNIKQKVYTEANKNIIIFSGGVMMKRFISIILTVFLVYISTISVMANDTTDFYQKNSNCKNYSYSKGNDLENEYINIDNKELLVNGIVENTSGDAEMFMAGYRWYSPSKAPSYLKRARYGSYSLSWHCYSLKLQTSLGNIAYGTFIGALGGPEGLGAGFLTSSFYEFMNYDRKSKTISYKDYVARATNNSRYLKRKRYTWTRAGYKGKYVVTYSYGLVL